MQSIIIKDFVTEDKLKDCLSVFFEGSSVSFFDATKDLQDKEVLFEYIFLKGDFKFELCLYTNIVFQIEDLSLLICKQFKTEVLISDDAINPYSWILITNDGKIGNVNQVVREDGFFSIQRPKYK